MDNIILIGMPGCGKSTLGVLLAKELGFHFTDTDLVIQEREQRLLQNILDHDGLEALLQAEERAILSLCCRNTVIATGGSAVFSERSMNHLKNGGKCVYLKLSLKEITRRIHNFSTRGIACKAGMTLADIYEQRVPLYEKYADLTINCEMNAMTDNVAAIIKTLI